jgi:hypothetical protein
MYPGTQLFTHICYSVKSMYVNVFSHCLGIFPSVLYTVFEYSQSSLYVY